MKQFGRKKRNGWLDRHLKDEFVQKSVKDGYRSRASYKLIEIQNKDKIFRNGSRVVDLGAAPGSWSQVASEYIGDTGIITALDLLPIKELPGVHTIQGDFTEQDVVDKLINALDGKKVDVIISDIAPNLTGIKIADQAASIELSELVLEFARNHLVKKGKLLIKVFHGTGFAEFRKLLEHYFTKVQTRKPAASRDSSRETYILASGYKY